MKLGNYVISVNPELYNLLLDGLFNHVISAAREILPPPYHSKILLDFYTFNILLGCGDESSLKLDYEFMSFLSKLKNKLVVGGVVVEHKDPRKNNLFIPSEFIYLTPHDKMGVFIKKQLIKHSQKHGINLSVTNNSKSNKFTSFAIGSLGSSKT